LVAIAIVGLGLMRERREAMKGIPKVHLSQHL
jgi:hypothetical protein